MSREVNLDQLAAAARNDVLLSVEYRTHWSWRFQQAIVGDAAYERWVWHQLGLYAKYLRQCPRSTLQHLVNEDLKATEGKVPWEEMLPLVSARAVVLDKGWISKVDAAKMLHTQPNAHGKRYATSIAIIFLNERCKQYLAQRFQHARTADRPKMLQDPRIQSIERSVSYKLLPSPEKPLTHSLIPPCILYLQAKCKNQFIHLKHSERTVYAMYWLRRGGRAVRTILDEWRPACARSHGIAESDKLMKGFEADLFHLQGKIHTLKRVSCKALVACEACPFQGDGQACATARNALEPPLPHGPLHIVYRPDQW